MTENSWSMKRLFLVLVMVALGACAEDSPPEDSNLRSLVGQQLYDNAGNAAEAERIFTLAEYCNRYTKMGDLRDRAETAFQQSIQLLAGVDETTAVGLTLQRRVRIADEVQKMELENMAGPSAKGAACDEQLPDLRAQLEKVEAYIRAQGQG